MQPTFLPWIGFLAMAEEVEEFVFLDDVQFDKRSWQQRNRVKTAQGIKWITVPVLSRGKADQRIMDVEIDTTAKFPRKQMEMIRREYSKAACFDFAFDFLSGTPLGGTDETSLCRMNVMLISQISNLTGLETSFSLASEYAVDGEKEEHLFNLCQASGASHYVAAPGSRDYLEESRIFSDGGIKVSYFDYDHPVYPQIHGEFVSHLSVLDLLMNVGGDAREVIRRGVRSS